MEEEILVHLPEEVDKLCRICMGACADSSCHNILLFDSTGVTLAGNMLQLINSNIIFNNSLPKSICDECAENLQNLHSFKEMCMKTEETLQKLLLNCVNNDYDEVAINFNDYDEVAINSNDYDEIAINSNDYDEVVINSNDSDNTTGLLLQDTLSDNTKNASQSNLGNNLSNASAIKINCECSVTDNLNKDDFMIDEDHLIKAWNEDYDTDHIEEINNYPDEDLKNKVIKTDKLETAPEMIKTDNNAIDSSQNIESFKIDLLTSKEKFSDEDVVVFSDNFVKTEYYNETERTILCEICGECVPKNLLQEHFRNCKNEIEDTLLIKQEIDMIDTSDEESSQKNVELVTIYKCDLCGKIFRAESQLVTHFYKHAEFYTDDQEISELSGSSYVCHVCKTCFDNEEDLNNHVVKHDLTRLLSCKLCFTELKGELNLVAHLRRHGMQVYACKICFMRCETEEILKEHIKIHFNENLFFFKCPICQCEFANVETLKRHSVSHVQTVYNCESCKRPFYNKTSYKKHLKQHLKPKHLCSICGKQYFSKITLNCHLRKHVDAKPFTCTTCHKSFASRATLSVHKRIHSTLKPFVCSHCGYSCRQSGDLVMHIRTHTGDKPYKCSYPNCERKFTTSSQRNEHYRRHINDRKHACMICGKSFLESKTLKVHMIVHTNERPFQCEICKKTFRRVHHLSTHMKSHKEIMNNVKNVS